jgi:hypothetical protein
MTLAEMRLVDAYRSVAAVERASIIRLYADMTHLSLGRAEDALDLWAHMLSRER